MWHGNLGYLDLRSSRKIVTQKGEQFGKIIHIQSDHCRELRTPISHSATLLKGFLMSYVPLSTSVEHDF